VIFQNNLSNLFLEFLKQIGESGTRGLKNRLEASKIAEILEERQKECLEDGFLSSGRV